MHFKVASSSIRGTSVESRRASETLAAQVEKATFKELAARSTAVNHPMAESVEEIDGRRSGGAVRNGHLTRSLPVRCLSLYLKQGASIELK